MQNGGKKLSINWFYLSKSADLESSGFLSSSAQVLFRCRPGQADLETKFTQNFQGQHEHTNDRIPDKCN